MVGLCRTFLRHCLVLAGLLTLAASVAAQQPAVYDDAGDISRALADAQAQGKAAQQRAERLEAEAARAGQAVERTARDAAAIAARIQQDEARIAANEAGIRQIARKREVLRGRLAERQQPLVRLTAALQRLSRRPPVLSLLRPGSVSDTMHMRAILETMLPEVARRTADLRAEIARVRVLEEQALAATRQLRASQSDLQGRRQALAVLEARQRLASRAAGGVAAREPERALALAEQARDLESLAVDVGRAGQLRETLALLPGPVIRPERPEQSQVNDIQAAATPPAGLPGYILPVSGKLVAGFGDTRPGLPRSRGIVLTARAGAQVVAPSAGRVAFAGPYRGYGNIVIVEHSGGWTSLVTGLAQIDTRVGETLVTGSPIGIAGAGRPILTLELRRQGEPVNPLDFVGAL